MRKHLRTKSILLLGILCAVLLGTCWICKDLFIGAPFSLSYALDGPSGVFPGNDGRMFIIDRGKKLILMTDERGMLSGTINCGRDSEDAPYYASLITGAPTAASMWPMYGMPVWGRGSLRSASSDMTGTDAAGR